MLRALFLLAVLLAFPVLAGCGSGGATAADGPASAVPAGAALYVEATIRPEGELREDALAAAGKVLRTDDPAAEIRRFVERAFAEGQAPRLDYGRDVEPWLGERAGFWMSGTDAAGETRGVVLLEATDTDEAQQAVDRALKRFTRRSHGGVDYRVGPSGTGVAVVGDFVALGTHAELKRTIDAADGESLATSDRYRKAIDDLEDERLLHFYLDAKALLSSLSRTDPAVRQQLELTRRFLPLDSLGPFAGAFTADGDRLALDSLSSPARSSALRRLNVLGGTASTPLVGRLPGDSWAAAGSPKLGETLKAVFGELAGAFGGAAIAGQVREQTGLDLEQDVFSWMGDTAFFVRGTAPASVDGGAVIEVTDEKRAATALAKIAGALRTRGGLDVQPARIAGAQTAFRIALPAKPVVLARGNGRVVVAYGEQAAADGLRAQDTLEDSPSFAEAEENLGDGMQPALLLSMPAVVSLVRAAGEADADFEKARPYLEAFGVVAAGGSVEDGRGRSRVVAGLK